MLDIFNNAYFKLSKKTTMIRSKLTIMVLPARVELATLRLQ